MSRSVIAMAAASSPPIGIAIRAGWRFAWPASDAAGMQLNARTTRLVFKSSAVDMPAPLRCHSSAGSPSRRSLGLLVSMMTLPARLGREVGADLRHRAVRHGYEHDGAECRRLTWQADVRARPELLRQRCELLGMARRHEHLMARIDPMARERAADAARADDADLERLLSCRNPRVDERHCTEAKPAASNSARRVNPLVNDRVRMAPPQ